MADILRRFNVQRVGYEGRILVLAHGFGSDQSVWNNIQRRFRAYGAGRFQLVLFDLACAGTVPDFRVEHYPDLYAYVADVLAILDALGIQSCTYIGHSMGASIGVLASIMQPHRFDELIRINFSPRFLNDPDTNYHGGLELEDVERRLAAIAEDYGAMVADHAPRLVGPDMPDELREFTRTIMLMPPYVAYHVTQTVLTCDLRNELPLVSVRCCIIQAIDDAAIPSPAMAQYVADLLVVPHTVYMLNAGGHLPHLM